jgi:hypothetical protein
VHDQQTTACQSRLPDKISSFHDLPLLGFMLMVYPLAFSRAPERLFFK